MEIANVPTLHQRRVNLCQDYFNRRKNKEHNLLARFLILYATGPHQCHLRLGQSDNFSCHGVYGIVHDVFFLVNVALLYV